MGNVVSIRSSTVAASIHGFILSAYTLPSYSQYIYSCFLPPVIQVSLPFFNCSDSVVHYPFLTFLTTRHLSSCFFFCSPLSLSVSLSLLLFISSIHSPHFFSAFLVFCLFFYPSPPPPPPPHYPCYFFIFPIISPSHSPPPFPVIYLFFLSFPLSIFAPCPCYLFFLSILSSYPSPPPRPC